MDHAESLNRRHARALEIASSLEMQCLYFPLSGGLCLAGAASLRIGALSTGEPVFLRAVELAPLATEAFGAAKDSFVVPYILKHSPLISSELVIIGARLMSEAAVFKELKPILLCLSLSVAAPIYTPFVLGTSWSALPAYKNQQIDIRLTESGYEDPLSFSGNSVDASVAAFVDSKLPTIRMLLKNKKFQIAVDAYETCLKLSNKRVAIATAWTGVEAIFGVNSELRFRIALYTASELAEADDPYNTFRDTMALYDIRSKIVHGAAIKEDQVNEAYGKSLGLLLTLLRVIVARGYLRPSDEIEKSLLSRK